MVFKAVFFATVLMVLGATALVGGRFLGLIDDGPRRDRPRCATRCPPRSARPWSGRRLEYAEELPAADGVRGACRWTVEEGDDKTLVEVSSLDADAWVVEFAREAADGLVGRRRQARRCGSARSSSARAPATGRPARSPPRSSSSTAPTAGRSGPWSSRTAAGSPHPRLVAQGCADGVFTRVVVAAPRLRTSATLERRATQALQQVESRLS